MALTDPKDIDVSEIDDSEESRHPVSYLAVDLTEQQRTDLSAWLHLHLTQIETLMQPILARFEQEDDQIEGRMPGADYPYAGAFRVNYPLTKRKVREIANRIKQAYLDADPIWGIDLDDPNLFQLAIKIEKALDTAIDHELDEEDDLSRACFDAAHHGTGAVMPTWAFHEERVRELESWKGWDQQNLESLEDILRFEQKYPNWQDEKELRKLHSLLNRGVDVEREVTATKVLKNHPDFRYIESKRLRVYPSVEGIDGLRMTPVYGFVTSYSRFELEEFARSNVIDQEGFDALFPESVKTSEQGDAQDAFEEQEEVEVFQGTIRYRLGDDETPCRYHVWYAIKDQIILRVRFYPWWIGEPDLIPFYSRQEESGFFKRGFSADIVDEHTCLNVLLNLYLNGIDSANALRLRTKYRSRAHQMILSRRMSPYNPLVWEQNPNEVDAISQSMTHLPAIVNGLELMRRQADEASGTSSLQSGRESPTDPNAPGIKTIALLQQVQPNEKDVLRSLEPAFRAVGRWTMWLYFQGLKLEWIEELPGGLQIEPELLPELAKHLHPRATLFDLDRQGRFDRNLGLLTITSKLVGQTRPDVVMKMLRITISQAGDQWARLVDTLDLERDPMGMGMPADQAGIDGQPATDPLAPSASNGQSTAPDDAMAAMVNGMGNRVGAFA